MITSPSNREKIVFLSGLLLVLLGIVLNEWFVAHFFSPDGLISSPTLRAIIYAIDILLISAGFFFIYFRARINPINIALYFASFILVLTLGEISLRLTKSYIDDFEDVTVWMENPNGTGSYRARPNSDLLYKFHGCTEVSLPFK